MIPWLFSRKQYIINLCENGISINNIFDDEIYANLTKENDGPHINGFLYKLKFLCVSTLNQGSITVWDLINKNVFQEIKFECKNCFEMIDWNNNYSIVGCGDYFCLINIEEGKIVKKLNFEHVSCYNIKRIELNKTQRCLLTSGDGFINLFISKN